MPSLRALAIAALALSGLLGAAPGSAAAPAASAPDAAQAVAEGKYLAIAGDCAACHTAPGGPPFAGGLAIDTPFGKILAPNITPDKRTGIGGMSNTAFIKALRQGIGHRGHLYPAMPYVYFNKVPDDQILAIRAYLNTLAPVDHKVVVNQLPFPYNIRPLMIGWNLLFFPDNGDFKPDPTRSAQWNRGAYLVRGLEHCAACHTPKNALGGDKTGRELQGYVVDGWNAPDITASASGIGGWRVRDIIAYLKTGHNQFAYASGPMADVVENSTSYLTDADLAAMAAYLKSVPGPGGGTMAELAANDPAMLKGAKIYKDECAACHTDAGTGMPGLFPSLTDNPAIVARDPATVIRLVLQGAQGGTTGASPTAPAMPAFGWLLTDSQAAAVLSYIRNSWGNAAPAVGADRVAKARGVLSGH